MRRPLRESDFKDYISAIYMGDSRYLTKGERYIVTKSNRRNKVTVKLGANPKIKYSNGGVEFSIGKFEIDVEEKSMVTLEDLSPEDRERLLQEARDLVDEENIRKNARTMYALKKKELVNQNLEEMSKTFKLKHGPEITRLKDRFVNITNYLYSLNKVNPKICTKNDWETFKAICEKVHECMVHCVKGK